MTSRQDDKVKGLERAGAKVHVGLTDAALIGMALIWGSNFIVVKGALGEFAPLAFVSLRFLIAALLLAVIVALRHRRVVIHRADWGKVALAGIIGTTIYQPLFANGLSLAPASTSSLIVASAPAFIALLNRVLRGERLARRGWAGILLSFLGIGLIVESALSFAPGSNTLLGTLMLLAGTLCWSIYSVLSAPLLKSYSPLAVTALSTVFGTVPLLLLSIPALLTQDWGRVDAVGWSQLAYSGIFAIVVAYIIWNMGVQRIGGARTALYNNLTPVIATLAAALLLNEPLTWLKIAGAVIIFVGLYLARTANIVLEPEA